MKKVRYWYLCLWPTFMLAGILSCESPTGKESEENLDPIPLSYAQGFKIMEGEGYRIIEVSQAFPKEHAPFRYLVMDENKPPTPKGQFDAIIQLPVNRLVLTSTTQIPHLDLLGVADYLVGFPNLDLISSTAIREKIEKGSVMDLGKGPQANVEKMIDLEPDLVMISTLGDDLRNLEILNRAQIPVVINGEYVEQHPLGRAEWIKFTGALFGKLGKAIAVFEKIKEAYISSSQLTENIAAEEKPSVLSGVMYKDIWYAPGNDSWGNLLLQDAGGKYVFEEQIGSGSVQLSFEYVLDKAQEAEFWIGASDFKSLEEMAAADNRYTAFTAFKNRKVYTYTLKKGPTGGIMYFELGYVRPDLILQDLIKILHPELLPEHSLYFYTLLDEK